MADEKKESFDSKSPKDYGTTSVNEVSLIDLWLILVRRKSVAVIAFVCCILVGLVAAFLLPRTYSYLTTIEIGRYGYAEDGNGALIESSDNVVAKIKRGYIPSLRQLYEEKKDPESMSMSVSINSPKKSNLVILKSKGPKEQEKKYIEFQTAIARKVLEDHSSRTDVIRNSIQRRIDESINELAVLEEETQLLEDDLKLVKDLEDLTFKKISNIKELISLLEANQKKALKESKDEAQAITLLLIGSEILREQRMRLISLEEKVKIDLPKKKNELAKMLAENRRAQSNQEAEIKGNKLELARVKETRLLVGPIRSKQPIGLGKMLSIILSLVIGLMLGVFSACCSEFIYNSRTKLRAAKING